jgi:predicted permease
MPEQLLHDLRDAVRALRKRPGFALVVILTLALGIGANTAIFSVVNRVLLQPLQFRDANRLYVMHEIVPQWAKAFPVMDANYEGFQIWKQQVHSFSEIAIAENTAMTLTGAGDPVQVRGTRGSANLLQLLGVRPVLGRPFSAAEDEAGHGQVVILTDAFWRGGFHADAGTVGRSIMLDGVAYTVVGVLPRSFHFPGMVNGFSQTSQYVIPLGGERWYEQGLIGDFDFTAIGRLREGVTLEQALAELNVVQARIAKLADSKLDLRAQLSPLQTEVVGSARNGLMLLMAAVGAVLLMICVNLANLLLARVPGRMREAGIRKALGATGARLTQHALVEYLLLGLLGGTGGVVLALFSARWMAQLAPLHLPRMAEIGVDGPALIFALTVSVLTAVLFGMLPALLLARTDLGATLAAGGKSVTESRRSRRLRSGLVGVQIALCTVLLIVAGLLGGSVLRLLNVDPGFDVDHVLAAEVYLPSGGYDRLPVRDAFYQRALDSIRSLPGVQSAAWVHILPLGGQGSGNSINLLGEQQLPSNEQPHANYRAISPDYFRTMQIPLIAGRTFDEHDRGKQRIIISNTLAKKLWPGKSPVGQQCRAMWGMLQPQRSHRRGGRYSQPPGPPGRELGICPRCPNLRGRPADHGRSPGGSIRCADPAQSQRARTSSQHGHSRRRRRCAHPCVAADVIAGRTGRGNTPFPDAADRHVRSLSLAAGFARYLWGCCLLGGAASPRVRHSFGAGSPWCRSAQAGHAPRVRAGGRRSARRDRGSAGLRDITAEFRLRHECARSADVRDRLRGGRTSGGDRMLHPCAPKHEHRPDGGIALRIAIGAVLREHS